MSDPNREKLVIGSLVHDIGKLVRRARFSQESHQLAGYDFTSKVRAFAEYQDFIHYHHERELKESRNSKEHELIWYTCLADNFSSKERMTTGSEFRENRRMENVLSKIPEDERDGKKTYFPVVPTPQLKEATTEMIETEENYRALYEALVEDAKKIPITPDDVNFLFYKYLSFMPQETRSDGEMDISLYDHLKVTAMLALCMYDYAKENNLSFETYQDLKKFFGKENVKPFLLVGGDVSGIQKFISNVSSKGALRSFRGRSFFIEILQEVVVDEILTRTGFYRTNVHFIGGGHFYLVLSNTEKVKKILNDIQRDINKWLKEKNLGLHLVTEYEEFSVEDIEDMSSVFSTLTKKLRLRKLRMFSNEELEELFPNDITSLEKVGNFTCKVCGSRVEKLFPIREWEEEEEIACEFCKEMYELGKELMKRSNLYLVEKKDGKFEIFRKRFDFSDKLEKGFSYKIRNIYDFQEDEKNVRRIQVVTYFKHQELDKIAQEAPGEKIASLLVDVDNLGNIFGKGLRVKTLSRYSTLSRLMNFFFKERVANIVEGKNLTVIYSGGDDLYLIGGWNDVLDVAKEMREEFSKFTMNDSITFSAGYVIVDKKTSMALIREMSERAEQSAKENGKDSISFSNGDYLAVKWKQFFEMYNLYTTLRKLVPNVDRSIIRKALNLTLKYRKEEDSPLNRAYLSYIEARENNEADKRVAALTKENLEKIGEPALNVILQFVDLLSRKFHKEG
ncbi:type III-A CRISPR-associated protein Cas10/Csm1 [Thermotoga sp. KOL6]|uniref:type III-A CRISPR-associated protein Cas10/Csm1 n=1 Tax=Thermotoga sp. KOL6 TaxID=126741 RepID=UPI000C771E71|nr:type III-A CRISPR-associated protein Cas10/Csm1 [Thermotoga sp. KOL6]PLV58074.1 type III-A CRISPR-associated protein Cas10/Csm1 [Thermotoga sp. KOL6]